MIWTLSEVLQHDPRLQLLLAGNILLLILALLLKRRVIQYAVLVCMVAGAAWTWHVYGFEFRWKFHTHQMRWSHQQGDWDAAQQAAKRRLSMARSKFPNNSVSHVEAVHDVGWLLANMGRYREAEAYLLESLHGYETLDPELPDNHHLVCTHGIGNEQYLLGMVYQHTDRLRQARAAYLKSFEHYKSRCPGYPQYQTEATDALAALEPNNMERKSPDKKH